MAFAHCNIADAASLERYLRATGRVGAHEPIEINELGGGVSNTTMRVRRERGGNWVIKQALEKLKVTVDWRCDRRRIEREALALARLAELAPSGAIPPLVFLDAEAHLLCMEAVPEPHENWKTLLLAGHVLPAHVEQFGRLLGTIHRLAWERRAELANEFASTAYFEALRLEPYYEYTAQQVPAAANFLRELITETRRTHLTLVHGDYSPKNVLVFQGQLVLLDHEVVHWGDPAFDLGFALTHLLSKARHLPRWRTQFENASTLFWTSYGAALGPLPWRHQLEPRAVRHSLACLLARAAGRSPLEYLSPPERLAQQALVLRHLASLPVSIAQLIECVCAEP